MKLLTLLIKFFTPIFMKDFSILNEIKNHNLLKNQSSLTDLKDRLTTVISQSKSYSAKHEELKRITLRIKFLQNYIKNSFLRKEKPKFKPLFNFYQNKDFKLQITQNKHEKIYQEIAKYKGYDIYDINNQVWKKISEDTNYTINTCYNLWINNYLQLTNIFTKKEEEFIYGQGMLNKDWIELGLYMKKNPFKIFKRYKKLTCHQQKTIWTQEEDKKLKDAVLKYGDGKWASISKELKTKNPKQCMHRYRNKFQLGIRKGRWRLDEDIRLKKAIEIFGSKKWCKISEYVVTRTDAQCRERFVNILDPQIKKNEWIQKEDEELLNLVKMEGEGNWSLIAKKLKGRTDAQCRRRYYWLSKNSNIFNK